MSKKLTIKIKNKIWPKIGSFFYEQMLNDSSIVRNLNCNGSGNQLRLLISYKAKGYFVNLESKVGRTIFSEIFKIVKVFSELGYCIDVLDCNDVRCLASVKSTKYDAIFGFGEVFYKAVHFNPNSISILYMTENHPDFSLKEETKRIAYFYNRHRIHAKIERSGTFYKMHHLDRKYSHVITLGEVELLMPQYENPAPIFPTGIINSDFIFKKKNHELARRNFLWLGSKGAIHKGLDILIDIFSQRDDLILHVCGLTKEDKKQIGFPKRKNIIDYGHIDIRSQLFLNIADTCTYSILPSCSEGCATSITTGMLHGLIPIVMRDSGFNRLGNTAFFLEDFKVDYMNSKLTEIANTDIASLIQLSETAFDFARKNFVLSAFEENFRIIINAFLANND